MKRARTQRLSALWVLALLALSGLAVLSCKGGPPVSGRGQPSILLVTLDTTRADSLESEEVSPVGPAFAGLAARGLHFTQAYATAPQTLPSHASMLTGLYPAGHGVHENGRRYDGRVPLVAERLREAGYATAAFVSGFPLDRQFGLERGFELYDDELGGDGTQRGAAATTARALDYLSREGRRSIFLWVHYYDAHEPYEPPEPYRSRFAGKPYLGELAAVDAEVGKLVGAFEAKAGERESVIVVVGDHGEGLGDHGESLHGNLLYQGVMRVPMAIAGAGITPAVRAEPVSTRRIFDTLLGWAGLGPDSGPDGPGQRTLLWPIDEPVMGEAMQPFLLFGWQPQVMAAGASGKAIRSGTIVELYDVHADPAETRDLAGEKELPPDLRQALRDYPLPSKDAASPGDLDEEASKRLASLGYLTSGAPPKLDPDAPRAKEMTHLFSALDLASGLFIRGDYAAAVPVLERILADDPGNLSVVLRLATAHSALGHAARATDMFERAAAIDPDSLDVEHYRALHELGTDDWRSAGPRLERVLAAMPERLAAIEGLAQVRRLEGRIPEAIALYQRVIALEREPTRQLLAVGELAMSIGDTPTALDAFERARALQGTAFANDLELGVLYMAQQRFDDSAAALDRVPRSHPAYPLVLFKRAQVAVLRQEADAVARVEAAKRGADEMTRPLIANERLFAGY